MMIVVLTGVQLHLSEALICISLVISNIEHFLAFFHVTAGHLFTFFGKTTIHVICSFSKWVLFFDTELYELFTY